MLFQASHLFSLGATASFRDNPLACYKSQGAGWGATSRPCRRRDDSGRSVGGFASGLQRKTTHRRLERSVSTPLCRPVRGCLTGGWYPLMHLPPLLGRLFQQRALPDGPQRGQEELLTGEVRRRHQERFKTA